MIRNTRMGIAPTDGLNVNHERNIRNTNKRTYNCGGYALGTYSWYCPYRDELEDYFSLFSSLETEIELDDLCVIYERIGEISLRTMLSDFAHRNIHEIKDVRERKENEIVVAFRFSLFDFHFMKLGANNQWYSKRGGCEEIETIPADVVFNEDGWRFGFENYDSHLMLLALEKEN